MKLYGIVDQNRVSSRWFTPLFSALGGVILVLILLALLVIALPELASPSSLIRTAGDPDGVESILITMGSGLIAVLFLMVTGTPLAYLTARTTSRWKGLIEGIIDIPLILPHTVAGLMVYFLFMSRGVIGAPFAWGGIFFEDAWPGIVAAMVFVSSPYYIDAVREGFVKVPLHLENVARTLGASRFQAFVRVTLPLSFRHICSGAFLAWGRAIGEFAAVIMIAYYPMVISALIYTRFTTNGIAESRGIAFLMILVSLGVFITARYLIGHIWREHDRA